MPSFGGDIGVYVKERCLDEEVVGVPRECDHVFNIRLIVVEIDHVSDFLPARCGGLSVIYAGSVSADCLVTFLAIYRRQRPMDGIGAEGGRAGRTGWSSRRGLPSTRQPTQGEPATKEIALCITGKVLPQCPSWSHFQENGTVEGKGKAVG
jgi:hypothetical protein